jgi:orotate phosphoribosyltransferase
MAQDADFPKLRTDILSRCLKFKQGFDKTGNLLDWVLDLREILHQMPHLRIAAKLLWERIRKYHPEYVGGAPISADPLTFAIIYEAMLEGYQLAGFSIRREAKSYGLRKLIEGVPIRESSRVVLVDDLINSGSTFLESMKHIEELRANVSAVAVIVDFERLGTKRIRDLGVPFERLTTLSELGINATPSSRSPRVSWTFGPLNVGAYTAPHSPPFISNDQMILVGGDLGFLVALNILGNELWRIPISEHEKGVRSGALVRGDLLYFAGYDGHLYCASCSNGRVLWSRRLADWIGTSPVLSASDNLIFVTGNYRGGSSACIAVDADTGDWVWEAPLDNFSYVNPLLTGVGQVIVGSNSGRLVGLENTTGTELWSFRSPAPIKGWLLSDNRACVFGSFDGFLYCVELNSGIVRWRRQLGDYLFIRPLRYQTRLIVPGPSHLVSVNMETSEVEWVTSTPGRMMGTAVDERNGTCIGGSDKGFLCAYDLGRGIEAWRMNLGGAIRAVPAVTNDLCVVPSYDGFLYGIDLSTIRRV